MALTIAIDREFHRNDSTIFPVVTISDFDGVPYIKIADWQYFPAPSTEFPIFPNNRSMIDCPVQVRDCLTFDPEFWEIDPPDADFLIDYDDITDTFTRSGAENNTWRGIAYTGILLGDVITVQATAMSINLSSGISLQDSPFGSHDYFSPDVAHAVIFGQNGQLTIRELGVKPKSWTSDYQYEVGDKAMIELIDNFIVKYYLIKPDNTMILLRTTLSKLTTDPTADVMLFQTGSSLKNVILCYAVDEVTFENIGVARRAKGEKEWQKWENQRQRISNAIPIQLADGEFEYTFPSSKKVLRQHSLTPKTYNNAGFQAFEDFFNWHGNEKNFIFVDEARKDAFDNKQEFWARFAGPMSDSSKNACLFDYGVPVIEAYRGDFIPRVTDETPPEISLAANSGSGDIAIFIATATDDQAVAFVRFYIDGRHIFNLDVTSGSDDYELGFGTTGIEAGTYDITAVAHDHAGNTATSNTQPLIVT